MRIRLGRPWLPMIFSLFAAAHRLPLKTLATHSNLVYMGITRGKKLVVLIGQRKALGMAVRNNRTENRFSGLLARLLTPG